MELKIKIGYNEILELIKQLPKNQLIQLTSDIDELIEMEITRKEKFQKKLLEGPVMTDEEYKFFLEGQKHIRHGQIDNI